LWSSILSEGQMTTFDDFEVRRFLCMLRMRVIKLIRD